MTATPRFGSTSARPWSSSSTRGCSSPSARRGFAFRGEVPLWMGWWGFGLAMHGMGAAPAIFRLLGSRKRALPTNEPPVIEAAPVPADELLPASFAEEVSRVKALLAERGGEGSDSLVAEVEQIAERARELARMDRDLEEQTSDEERTRLSRSVADAERKAREGTARAIGSCTSGSSTCSAIVRTRSTRPARSSSGCGPAWTSPSTR